MAFRLLAIDALREPIRTLHICKSWSHSKLSLKQMQKLH